MTFRLMDVPKVRLCPAQADIHQAERTMREAGVADRSLCRDTGRDGRASLAWHFAMSEIRQAGLTSSQPDAKSEGMTTPGSLERQHILATAVARYDDLRARDLLASTAGMDDDPFGPGPLSRQEALELLALGEVIARKAAYGRQLTVRSARTAGASWSQIGAALGTSKQSAWEAHSRWIDQQAQQHRHMGFTGMNEHEAAAARALAGQAGEDDPG
jgi:hypothetical protein